MRLYTFTIITLIAFSFGSQSNAQYINIETSNGDFFSESLVLLRNIAFPDNNLVLSTTDLNSITINLLSVKKICFGKDLNTGSGSIVITGDELQVYPNPSDDFIMIDHLEGGTYGLTIFSIQGKVLMHKNKFSAGEQLDISLLEPGIYFLKINGQTFKFMKL